MVLRLSLIGFPYPGAVLLRRVWQAVRYPLNRRADAKRGTNHGRARFYKDPLLLDVSLKILINCTCAFD